MRDLKPFIAMLANGGTLSEAEAQAAFHLMMEGEATPTQIGAFLMALRLRGETIQEITGAVRAMRAKMIPLQAPPNAIDVCGTGGDGAGTLNISTAVSFVAAACGLSVAKHGNRAASSKSGAADILAALGVNVEADFRRNEQALREVGTAFLWAQRHHTAMRHVGPSRTELGMRTIFNLMGPLSNPAGVKRQLIGVFSKDWLTPLAQVLLSLGSQHAWLVHGEDGLDEITITGSTQICELKDGTVRSFTIAPEDVGLPRATISDIKGGDPEHNAHCLRELFAGERNAYRDIVLMNSAAALLIGGKTLELKEGVAMSAHAIDSGQAQAKLDQLIHITQMPAPAEEEA